MTQTPISLDPGAGAGREARRLGGSLFSSLPAAWLARGLLLAVAAFLGLGGLAHIAQRLLPEAIHYKDVLPMYLLAKAVATGTDPLLPLPVLAERFASHLPPPAFNHPTPHPPTLGLLLLPIAYVDYTVVATAWVAVELACLVGAVFLLRRATLPQLPVWATIATALALLAWFPVWHGVQWGQVSLLLLLLLSGLLLAVQSGRSALAGGLLGLSFLIKPLAWPLLLLFALRRDWRLLAGTAAPLLLGYAAAAWVIGVDRVFAYFTQTLPVVTEHYRSFLWNHSLWTIGERLFRGTGGITTPPMTYSESAARLVAIAIPVLLLALACVATRRPVPIAWAIGVMVCLSIVVSPLAWPHYLVLACLPVALVLGRLVQRGFPIRETRLALLATAPLLVGYAWWEELAFRIAGQPLPAQGGAPMLPFAPALLTLMPTLGVVALGCLTAWLGWREATAAEPASARRADGPPLRANDLRLSADD